MPFRFSDRPNRGQALVEFALVIPVFLVILMGVADLGRAVFAYNSITNAAREGARLAIVNQDVTSIKERAVSQAAMADTSLASVAVAFRKTTPNADYMTNPDCKPYNNATRPMALDCVAIVTYQTTYRPITPIISSLVFGGGVTLTAESILNIEFVCPNVGIPAAADCPKQP